MEGKRDIGKEKEGEDREMDDPGILMDFLLAEE
jgi:hypothetical protein